MPKPQVKVFNPKGRNGYTSLKSARHAVERGRARWREENAVVEYIERTGHFVSECRPAAIQTPKPARAVMLEVTAIDSATCDSNMAQTFLAYPQPSRDSYSPAFPGLALDNAGLG